jgi:putative ABC transport system ATP-binding protein/lipoprotein-releasing system ATP-binding protein
MEGSSMPDILVDARGLSRTYGSGRAAVTALVSATFRVSAGDLIALVGPSGSGKSTLLHLIGGLDRPTAGDIGWPGIGTREQLRPGPIAMAFQGPSLLPPLTVLENVALPVLLTGGDADAATVAAQALLELFEIDEVADKLPEEISGGQAQRAGIARALAGGPKLVLADEPTGQQDHATGGRLMDALLEAIVATGAALVVATHDPVVAERLATRWSVDAGLLATEDSRCSA